MPSDADVHIVVPTLGHRPELLDVCLESLLGQSHPVRVTVIAGDCHPYLGERWARHPTIKVSTQRGSGLSAAINQAWQDDAWTSTFASWLGDDDALPPDSISSAVAILADRPNAPMVHGRCLMIDENGSPRWVARNGRLGAALAGYGINLIAQPGCLFRTSALRAIGGLDESLSLAMDVDLYSRLRRLGPLATAPQQLGVFRQHTGGLSTAAKSRAAAEARAAQVREHHRRIEQVADRLAIPLTRIIGRVSQRLPPPAAAYWRPHA